MVKRTRSKIETNPEAEAAKALVERYEELREEYEELQAEFREEFPEAAAQVDNIKMAGDQVLEAIASAKIAVAAAKMSFGDFQCQRKFQQAGYDPDLLVKTCLESDQEILIELFRAGVVKKVTVDRESAILFVESRQLDELFDEAWVDKREMTPAVTVPKFVP